MSFDPTFIAQLEAVAAAVEEKAGTDPGALRRDTTAVSKLKRIADALSGFVTAIETHFLPSHEDVLTTMEPNDGDFLRYDDAITAWSAQTAALTDLADVVLTGLASGEFLQYDGTDWVNTTLDLSDLPAIDLLDLNDVTGSPTLDGNLIRWDISDSEWQVINPQIWSRDYTLLTDHLGVAAVPPYTNKVLIGTGGTDWVTTALSTAGKNVGLLHQDGTIPLTANWDAGDYKITSKQLAIDGSITDTSHDKLNMDMDISETGLGAGRIYRGLFLDLDYNYNGVFDSSKICGLEFDIDLTTTAGVTGQTPQLIKAVITNDANTQYGSTAPNNPVYIRIQNNRTTQAFGDGGINLGLEAGTTSGTVIGVRAFASAAGSGNLLAYQGYAQGLAGASGQATGLEAFIVTQSTMSRIVGIDSKPQASIGGGLPTTDKIMSYRGEAGHCLISRGSLFVTSTTRTDPNAFASTHLTHTNLDGDGYFEGKLEVDDTGYFDATGTALEILGDLVIKADNKDLKCGAGGDMDIGYDGTDGYINTNVVAASDLTINCGTDKTLELQESVYKDLNLGAAMLALPAASQPDEVQFTDEAGAATGIYSWGFAVGEKVSGNFELQHDYKEGTDLVFHVHWQGITAPTGTDKVQWQLTYTVAQSEATLDAPAIITVETDFDTQYEFKLSSFAEITGTNYNIGDQFLFTLERIAATADEYAGDAIVATVGVHYEVDTLGSRQMTTK